MSTPGSGFSDSVLKILCDGVDMFRVTSERLLMMSPELIQARKFLTSRIEPQRTPTRTLQPR